MSIYFVAGGARSGKSRKGEELARTLPGSGKPVFIATAEAIDEEETLSLEAKEIELIKKSLERNKGKRKAAADELGISERTLYRKIKQYDL